MFLLFLCLGAASVKAQVRIGGNTAPNGAAVLDLNATDATNNGTKGLALPRVNLTSNTMQLTSGVVNLTGMLVYNTTATLGAGIYFWTGSQWVVISGDGVVGNGLMDTIGGRGLTKTGAGTSINPYKVGIMANKADSSGYLQYNGYGFVWGRLFSGRFSDTVKFNPRLNIAVTWSKILDTTLMLTLKDNSQNLLPAPGIVGTDYCNFENMAGFTKAFGGQIIVYPMMGYTYTGSLHIRCYRPSL